MATNAPASPTFAYGWKIANAPHMRITAARGCFRSRMVRIGEYEAMWSQKTPRKNDLKESNISMKKYHHNPTFGVRSGSSSRVP